MGISSVYDSLNEMTFSGNPPEEMDPAATRSLDLALQNGDEDEGGGKKGGLRFGSVHVREYNRTVGDHPDASDDGPPLTIDWEYVQLERQSVKQYERMKRKRRQRRLERRDAKLRLENQWDRAKKRLPNIEFSVPRIKGVVRREILHLDFDVPFQELVQAEVEAKRIRRQREESNAQSPFSERTEELFQSASRKVRRSFAFGYGRNGIAGRGGGGGGDQENNMLYPSYSHSPYGHPYGRHDYNQYNLFDRRQLRRSKAFITNPSDGNTIHAYNDCFRGI